MKTVLHCIRQYSQNQYTPSAGIGLKLQSPGPQSETHFQTKLFSRLAISPPGPGMGGRSGAKHFPILSGIQLQSTTNKPRLKCYKLTYNSTPFIVQGAEKIVPAFHLHALLGVIHCIYGLYDSNLDHAIAELLSI